MKLRYSLLVVLTACGSPLDAGQALVLQYCDSNEQCAEDETCAYYDDGTRACRQRCRSDGDCPTASCCQLFFGQEAREQRGGSCGLPAEPCVDPP